MTTARRQKSKVQQRLEAREDAITKRANLSSDAIEEAITAANFNRKALLDAKRTRAASDYYFARERGDMMKDTRNSERDRQIELIVAKQVRGYFHARAWCTTPICMQQSIPHVH